MKPIIYDFDILREEDENKEKEDNKNKQQENPTKPNEKNKNNETNLDLSGNENKTDDNAFGSGDESDLLGGNSNEPDYTLTDIGKTYILEKVYDSLNDLLIYCNFLYRESSKKEIEKIRNDIFQAKELFVLLSSNIDKYMDKLDSIINEYRKFVSVTSKILYNYSKDMEKK